MPILTYLRSQLNQDGAFIPQWRQLSDADKAWYKAAGEVEMKLLGIEIK